MINQIKERIDKAIMDIASKKTPRKYLGASSIGEACDRKLWYSFHSPEPIKDPRVHRIMDFGHFSESYVVSMLKHAGYILHIDEGNEQFGFEDEEVAGHIDGVIIVDEKPFLLEIKSANEKRFNEMVKSGVERSDPTYFVQMQVYMKYMDLTEALFFVINKNTCEIHMEVIKYEKIKADYAVNRGKEIIRGTEEQATKGFKSPAFYKCKWCDHKEKCWSGYEESPKPSKEDIDSFKLGGNFLLRK